MKTFLFASLLTVLTASLAGRAEAVFIYTVAQVGNNVVVNGSGTIDTLDLSLQNPSTAGSGTTLFLRAGLLGIDPTYANLADYHGISGPESFGSGGPRRPAAVPAMPS